MQRIVLMHKNVCQLELENQTTIDAMKRAAANQNIDNQELHNFIVAVTEYKQTYNIMLDARNFGFLVENEKYTPVVWSSLTYKG